MREVLISHKNGLIYHRTFRTASSSIYEAIKRSDPEAEHRYLKPGEHFPSIGYCKIACIRDPWSRLLSVYMGSVENSEPDPVHVFAPLGFSRSFFDQQQNDNIWKIRERFRRIVNRLQHADTSKLDRHLHSQFFYVPNGLDFIIRFDYLNKDWRRLRRQFPLLPRLPKINRTKHDHPFLYYTPEMFDVVRDKYKYDVQNYGFSFADLYEWESSIINRSWWRRLVAWIYKRRIKL
jgi:hypothetical protein